MRRRTFLTVSGEGMKAIDAMAADVCLYNKTTEKLLIVKSSDFNSTTYPKTNYSPVGVVVIPGSHDVYGTGECAVMSIKEMSCSTPDNGSESYEYLYWGSDTDISSLYNFNKICYVGVNGTVNESVQGETNNEVYLSSDNFSSIRNPYDKDTYYSESGNEYFTVYYVPSPYLTDDTRNPAYYQTSSPSSSNNAMSDFDGIGNTTKLINLATGQFNWKTASTITNSYNSGYYPAACCCWRYHTDGTKQGDWYLPAIGEMGYIMPKFKKIKTAITNLNKVYGIGFQLSNLFYYSSTEKSYDMVHNLSISDGNIGYAYGKRLEEDGFARAFLRVK